MRIEYGWKPGSAILFRKSQTTRYNSDMIHLHTRSCYSLLESTLDIDGIIRKAKENGQSAVALTDHRSMYGTMAFLHAAKKAGLKPIIGLEFEIRRNEQLFSLLAFAQNTQGLQNLYKLSTTLMSQDGPLPFEELPAYSQNLIVMNAGGDVFLETLAHEKDLTALSEFFIDLQAAVPQTYMALALQDSPRYRESNQLLKNLAPTLGLECVALSRIEYEKPEDENTLRLLQAIAHAQTIHDPQLMVRRGRYYRTPEEMAALYEERSLAMTDEIAASIEEYEIPKAKLPVFVNKTGVGSEEYLKNLCIAGLKKRLNGKVPAAYANRLNDELEVILSMGFADYFLIVWDFIREARKREILVGPGRGSAAGSLVSWCLGISHIDPLANHLLFERFLNPGRVSMPDIDTDFPDNRRDEIIEYVQSVYGRYHAAHIVTFARMKAKSALRDCARAMNVPMREIDRLSKLLPNTPNLTLQDAYQNNRPFASLINNNPSLKQVYEAAIKIEGFPRHASIHAGGIVLARDSILNQAPLQEVGEALPAVQFTMEYLEEIGLIKFDFLSLRNLTTLANMTAQIESQTGNQIDLLKLPLNDPLVYQILRNGDTQGIFQLESAGIRDLILRYRPVCFEDIAAILALYRPGPMKNIDLFLDARFHPEHRRSIHPLIDPLLAETGGIFVYQEQIMEAARLIGGFTLSEADILRKAMSKKKPEVMKEWEQKFIEGARKNAIEETSAREIFATMSQFAEYGFNKSHSYVYGLIVYQMAWIKARYPLQFYQCSLNSCIGSGSKTNVFLQECHSRRIPILPISLNNSEERFVVQNQALRMPLSLIKSINRQTIEKIQTEKKTHGYFDDPCLAILRLLHAGVNATQLLALIQAGALDELRATRESLEAGLEGIAALSDLVTLENNVWKFSGITPPELEEAPIDRMKRLQREKELLGFYVTRHPSQLIRQKNRRIFSTVQAQDYTGKLQLAGIIHSIKEHKTKKGQMMAFAILSDDTGDINLSVMPWVLEKIRPVLKENQLVWIAGNKDRPSSVLVNQYELITKI